MADFVYNIAKGRVAELANRVNANDPTNSVFVLELIISSATDATLRDLDTFAAIESDGNTAEITSGTHSGYARKVLTDASSITVTTDDTNDRVDVDCPDQTWTALGAGAALTDLVIGYDSDSTGGTDSGIVPMTQHDFVTTPDGSDIVAQIAVFYRAS